MATNNNRKIINRKEWQMMNPSPVAPAIGSFIVKDPLGIRRTALFVNSATVQYLYAVDEDAFMLIPSMALGGTFGAGACGTWGRWGNTLTANGGSTTTITTATAVNGGAVGLKIRFKTGLNAGLEATITDQKVIPGGTCTFTFAALGSACANGDTFEIDAGRYYIFNAGTLSATSFKSIDPITGVITALSITGLPSTWGTDGRIVATPSYVGAFATGTATSGGATSITDTSKAWTASQWKNYQVRITSGLGVGQIRTITDNSPTALTVATWTVIPDSTSVYAIEANDDFLYLLGNDAVTMYRYSISGNSWSTLSPGVARAAKPIAGMGANWLAKSKNALWMDETDIKDGRYIYSFRGGASTLDRYDIAANAWLAVTYTGAAETFSTGSSYDIVDGRIYIRKEASGRYFFYDAVGNYIYPFAADQYPESTAQLGEKIFTATYYSGSGDYIAWLYNLGNTSAVLRRIPIF